MSVVRLGYTIPRFGLTNGVSTIEDDIAFASPIVLNPNKNLGEKVKIRVNSIRMSARIPNIFNASPYYQFDNRKLRVYTDNPGSTVDITLERGLYYTVDLIADAINKVITDNHPTWYADVNDPAIKIEVGDPVDRVIVTLDSTKLGVGHTTITLDLSKASTGTDLANTLGFMEATSVLTSLPGVATEFYSNMTPMIDAQGPQADLHCSLIAHARYNRKESDIMANVSIRGIQGQVDVVYPQGGQTAPDSIYEGGQIIPGVKYRITKIDGQPMVFMSGDIYIEFSFVL